MKSCKAQWRKGKTGFENTKLEDRHIWHTKNHHYGLVVHKMAYGGKYYVGYNSISIPNTVDLGVNVTKKKAVKLANNFMKGVC